MKSTKRLTALVMRLWICVVSAMRHRRRQSRAEQRVSQYGVEQPQTPLYVYDACPAPLRQSDERYCTRCGLRWAADEAKPPCANSAR